MKLQRWCLLHHLILDSWWSFSDLDSNMLNCINWTISATSPPHSNALLEIVGPKIRVFLGGKLDLQNELFCLRRLQSRRHRGSSITGGRGASVSHVRCSSSFHFTPISTCGPHLYMKLTFFPWLFYIPCFHNFELVLVSVFLIFKNLFVWLIGEAERQSSHRSGHSPNACNSGSWARLEARSPEFSLGFPRGWQGTKDLSHHHWLSPWVRIIRMLP